jgi:cyclophilin family peptidyl-prolyl cis-trans isomerase
MARVPHPIPLPEGAELRTLTRLVVLVMCLSLAGLGSAVAARAQTPKPAEPPTAPGAGREKGKRVKQQAVITMVKGGDIVIDFFPEDAPKTVENFVTLAKKGYYDGIKFHRVEPGFVVQGGDPKGDGTGGPGYTIKAEFNKRPHVRGSVAMARRQDPDSAGSQFYITFGPQSSLDGKYTVFGQVVKGMEVIDQIKVGDKMKTVKILEVAP